MSQCHREENQLLHDCLESRTVELIRLTDT